MTRVLLVNPWIVDAAAHNFWLRPLGLYELAVWLHERGAETALADCLSPFPAPGKFRRTKFDHGRLPVESPAPLYRYGITMEEFAARVRSAMPFDAALVTSAMAYWYPGVSEAIEIVRKIAPEALISLGGVYPTLFPEHARRHSGADSVHTGTLKANSGELAQLLGLPASPLVPGKPWYALGLHDGANYQGMRTARGCPYDCTYCASKFLSDGFDRRAPSDLADELAALGTLGVTDVAFYDDALLVGFRERVLPALKEARAGGARFSFHTPNGLHAALLDDLTAREMVEAGFKTFRLSLETTDRERALETGGKVSARDLERAVKALLKAGAPHDSIGVYLLMGLPGQEPEEVAEGIRFVRSLGVRPRLAEFSPIPGTREWEKLARAGVVSETTDPLLTNNSTFITTLGGYGEQTVRNLMRTARATLP